MVISNEHPEALERMAPDDALETRVRAAAKMLRGAKRMTVTSPGGTNLDVDMAGAPTVGIWGWTEKPGTLAHWPGGIVVSFPKARQRQRHAGARPRRRQPHLQALPRGAGAAHARGRLRHAASKARARTPRCSARYLAAWGDQNAYAVSHVGFGLNPKARYEALTMYDQRDTNGTEIRAVAGNFLFSTGANEFAGRYTAGHFDLPVMRTTITVDGTVVVKDGVVQDVFES